jgi:hypothetical protein
LAVFNNFAAYQTPVVVPVRTIALTWRPHRRSDRSGLSHRRVRAEFVDLCVTEEWLNREYLQAGQDEKLAKFMEKGLGTAKSSHELKFRHWKASYEIERLSLWLTAPRSYPACQIIKKNLDIRKLAGATR